MRRLSCSTLFALCALVTVLAGRSFATAFGTLSSFDVVNDTPSECHGFEIELEDIHQTDVPYTFGGTYTRYGTPEVLEDTTDPAHPRVLVRYRHWNGSAWEATPVAPPNVTPSGHDCFAGGPIGNYLSSGCEHYGVSLSANPTRTTYRWLVAASPADLGSAFSVVPQTVNIPVPVWNVAPIAVAAGGGVNFIAEVEPVEEENEAQHGEPQWMKVFKLETELDLEPDDLILLLLGGAGNILPDETEIETEWKLMQSKPGDAEEAEEDADVKEDPLDDGKHSVRRTTGGPNGQIIVRGDVVLANAGDTFDAIGGILVRIADGPSLDETFAFASADCKAFASGRISCRSDDRRLHASLRPSAVAGRLRFHLRFDDLTLAGPFTSELTVAITSEPPVPTRGLDRVGTIAGCRTTTNAMLCVAH